MIIKKREYIILMYGIILFFISHLCCFCLFFLPMVYYFNSITVPVPIGMQLMSHRSNELGLFRVSLALEQRLQFSVKKDKFEHLFMCP